MITQSANIEAAWRSVELALPDGWIIRSLTHDGMTWDARATPYGSLDRRIQGMGDTPAEALHALAATLRAVVPVGFVDLGPEPTPPKDFGNQTVDGWLPRSLRRRMFRDRMVDHIDGDPTNNDPANLRVKGL